MDQEMKWSATVDSGVLTPTPINALVSFPSDGRAITAASLGFVNWTAVVVEERPLPLVKAQRKAGRGMAVAP